LPAIPTRRVVLEIDGARFTSWTEVTITRDLGEVCSSFEVATDDIARSAAALPGSRNTPSNAVLKPFQAVKITLDGELVLKGWIDIASPEISDRSVGVRISGRDVTGDLMDCAAAPLGPVEYKAIKLEALAAKLCQPFGVTVTAEVDTGEPIRKVSIEQTETVMSVLEKYTRKRAILMVSDGVGGLILTRSGTGRAPGDLRLGVNVAYGAGTFDGSKRYSVVYVKGQAGHAGGKRKAKAALDATAEPLDAASGAPAADADADAATGREARAVTILGIAYDDEVGRYRPSVRTPRAASASAEELQREAEWYVSTARGAGDSVEYDVHDWREGGTLWRANQMAHVIDAYQDIDKDLLIAGAVWRYGPRGTWTSLRVCGKEAYDLLEEADDEGGGGGGSKKKRTKKTDVDVTAEPLE
jgi:prophage tail gpP-like protein